MQGDRLDRRGFPPLKQQVGAELKAERARLSNLQGALEREIQRLRSFAAQCDVREVASVATGQANRLQSLLDESRKDSTSSSAEKTNSSRTSLEPQWLERHGDG